LSQGGHDDIHQLHSGQHPDARIEPALVDGNELASLEGHYTETHNYGGVPVDIGLVASLNRPGGNMTGVTFEAATETYGLRLQMLKEIIPNIRNVAVLKAKGDPNVVHAIAALEKAAPSLGIKLTQYESSDDLPAVFQEIERSKADGLVSIAGAFTLLNSHRLRY
jgi:hypothetical protein